MANTGRQKVCLVTTSPFIVRVFLTEHANRMIGQYDVTVICNVTESNVPLTLANGVRLLSVRIERNMSPWRDLLALFRLIRIFRSERFDVVHSVSPKAGLLAQVAALVARVPRRVHTFTGQVWAAKTGAARWLLKLIDRFYAACATHVLVDSLSQRAFLSAERVVSPSKGQVLGDGSISGVDVHRFTPNAEARAELRNRLNIPLAAPLFLYLGRLKRDKGIIDLAKAFADHASRFRESRLLLVGPDEDGLSDEIRRIGNDVSDRIVIEGFTPMPETYLAAADVLCLPSYREGFGSVIIEAAACGIPAIGSRIYGITDAIVDKTTGLLHEPGNSRAIAVLMDVLVQDDSLRTAMGRAARERALKQFSKEVLTDALLRYYEAMLAPSNNHPA